ncbi:MAG: MFS transporter [Pseudomonadota bacterium]
MKAETPIARPATSIVSLSAISRARWAISIVFLVNGAIFGSWAPHIALTPDRLGIGAGALGLAFLAMAFGAIMAMQVTGRLINSYGSAHVTRVSGIMMCVALLGPILAPSIVLFVIGLFVLGASNGTMDVAMNAHGVAVENALQRPIMSSLHGMFSTGGFVGASMGGISLEVILPFQHALIATGVALVLMAWALPRLLPASFDLRSENNTTLRLPDRALLGLGALAFFALMAEGSILDWGALLLQEEAGANPSIAALGFAAFSLTMAASRFSGDFIRHRVGLTTLVRSSALVAATGLTIGLLFQWPIVVIFGFAVTGLGLANLVPVLFTAAGSVSSQSPGNAIAAVATLGYLGFLAGPPMIGFLAEATNLIWGLSLVAVACVIIAASCGPFMRTRSY